MKKVLAAIMKQKREYADLPLFNFMRDESLTAKQRLAFYPCMAHFIMSFGDLNKFVLRDESSQDEYQQMVNTHTYEDDHHWPWYIEDFRKLGFSGTRTSTGMLNLMWGEDTKANRQLLYGLTKMINAATSVQRLAIIEAIEETGNVLFDLTTKLAEQIEKQEGIELRYCGHFHFSLESGHTVGADHKALVQIELTDEDRTQTMEMATEVFRLFAAWTEELLRFAKTELQKRATARLSPTKPAQRSAAAQA